MGVRMVASLVADWAPVVKRLTGKNVVVCSSTKWVLTVLNVLASPALLALLVVIFEAESADEIEPRFALVFPSSRWFVNDKTFGLDSGKVRVQSDIPEQGGVWVRPQVVGNFTF